jgi:hypothetical protein
MRATIQPMRVQPKKKLMRRIHQKFWTWREPAMKVGRKWMKSATAAIRMMTRMGKPRRKLMGESIAQGVTAVQIVLQAGVASTVS